MSGFDFSKIRQLSNKPTDQELVEFSRDIRAALLELYTLSQQLGAVESSVADAAATVAGLVAAAEEVTVIELPTTPTGLLATPDFAAIGLSWDIPSYLGHSFTQIWRATTDDFTAATKIGTSQLNVYNDVLLSTEVLTTYYYWVQHVNGSGEVSASSTVSETPNPYYMAPPTDLVMASGSDHLYLTESGSVISRIFLSWAASLSSFASGYEVEYKALGSEAWLALTSTEVSAYLQPVQPGTFYDIRVRAKSPSAKSAWLTGTHMAVGKLEPPPAPDYFLVTTQGDGTREFRWELANPPVDVRVGGGFKIRYKSGTGHVWADMTDLHGGLLLVSPYEVNQLGAGEYTFALKTVDSTGNESTDALYIVATIGSPRLSGVLAEVYPRDLSWPGTLTNCYIETNGDLAADDQKDWSDFDTDVVDWDNWTAYARDPYLTIIYEHPVIDAGSIANIAVDMSVITNGSVTNEISTSTDDVTYGAWAVAGGLVLARYIKARTTVTIGSGVANITAITIRLTADTMIEDVEDLDSSLLTPEAGGGFRIPLTKTFLMIRKVDVALQNVGAGCTWELIDKSISGPHIKVWDSTNTLTYPLIDATIKGL